MSSFRSFCSHFHYLSPSRLRYLFQQSPVDRQRDVRKTLFSLASPRPTEVEELTTVPESSWKQTSKKRVQRRTASSAVAAMKKSAEGSVAADTREHTW